MLIGAMTGKIVLSSRRTVTNGFQASIWVSSVSTIVDLSSMNASATNILHETYECTISLSLMKNTVKSFRNGI